jgi:copper(I)-binding protein
MNFLRIHVLLALAAGIFLAACGPREDLSGPGFEEAWVRPLPPGMKMTAGFGKLHNPGDTEMVFTSFSSPSFGDVSLHRTEQVNGVSKMREVPELRLAAGESVVLEPGSYHLMLMMPTGEIQPGQTITITMTADDGRIFGFDVPVERR